MKQDMLIVLLLLSISIPHAYQRYLLLKVRPRSMEKPGLCLSNENAWKDWDDETCKYYAKTTGACDGYNQFAAKYPGYPKENPCCACKVLEQNGFSFRKDAKGKGCTTKMEGFVVKQDTECKNYEKQFVVPCLEGDQCAFAGCEDVNCNMIVNDKGEGKKFRVCHGEPVTAPDGSCSWVKGTAKKESAIKEPDEPEFCEFADCLLPDAKEKCKTTCSKVNKHGEQNWCDMVGCSSSKMLKMCPRTCKIKANMVNEGKHCWYECEQKQGFCDFCGSELLCCRKEHETTTNGCDGTIGGEGNHVCVAKPGVNQEAHCTWSLYSSWSDCSVTCGEGTKTSTRKEATAAVNGGKPCTGDSTKTETCNKGQCPVPIIDFAPDPPASGCPDGNHAYGGTCCCANGCCWTNCDKDPKNYGACLRGMNSEWVRDHENGRWMAQILDARWTEWSSWSSCSKTCGHGQHTRTRRCKNPKRLGHSESCSGNREEKMDCNKRKTSDECWWKGTSPFCSPSGCESGSTQVASDVWGDGATCLTGSKRKCCRTC